ncbi:MAG: hypothetical protein KKB30_09975 [Proteobacteria bacterium]|nr:hypothetical protein [Pseudomonadota bacterium]
MSSWTAGPGWVIQISGAPSEEYILQFYPTSRSVSSDPYYLYPAGCSALPPPEPPPCDAERTAAEAICNSGAVTQPDPELCIFECVPKPCSQYAADCSQTCAGAPSPDNTWAEGADGDCLFYDCACENTMTCQDHYNYCNDSCSGNIYNFSCEQNSGQEPVITVPCECYASDPTDPGDVYDPFDPESSPGGGFNGSPNLPDPPQENGVPDQSNIAPTGGELDNQLLSIIAANTNAIANNTTLTANILDSELNELNANTLTTNDKIDAVGTKISSLNESIDNLQTSLEGSYTAESITNDYNLPISDISEFTCRFNSFITEVKATPLFSLPNQILFNIPNSSASVYTFDLGSYGTADIDFADYATPLLALRAAFLICFSYAALRIVISKR